MNGDGRDDVVVAMQQGIGVFSQDQQGQLEPLQLYPTATADRPIRLVGIADVDDDGRNDVVAVPDAAEVEVFRQQSDGTLAPPIAYPKPTGFRDGVGFGDVTGDGLNDLVLLYWGQVWDSGFAVLPQTAGHDLGSPVATQVRESDGLAVGDVTGDGRSDVVLGMTTWVYPYRRNPSSDRYSHVGGGMHLSSQRQYPFAHEVMFMRIAGFLPPQRQYRGSGRL